MNRIEREMRDAEVRYGKRPEEEDVDEASEEELEELEDAEEDEDD